MRCFRERNLLPASSRPWTLHHAVLSMRESRKLTAVHEFSSATTRGMGRKVQSKQRGQALLINEQRQRASVISREQKGIAKYSRESLQLGYPAALTPNGSITAWR